MALPLLAAASAVGQAASVPSTLEGTWRCTLTPEQARATALAAFEPRFAAMPAFIRGMVASRVAERLRPTTRMEIAIEGDQVRVTSLEPGRVVVETRLGGSTRVRGSDGETRRVTQRIRGGWLEQVYQGENGVVRRLLSTEPDGRTLHMDFTVENERLGEPVRWRLDYRR